jgi:hypothetical protein
MATRKPAGVDPLITELPEAEEPRPKTASDVFFDVEISPYVVSGEHFFRWTIVGHNAQDYVGSYVGQSQNSHKTAGEAEESAAEFVSRIRHTVDLKLNAPDSYRITL